MDAISYSLAAKQAQRIKKVIAEPDSVAGLVTIPNLVPTGETITIPAGRTVVHPNLQVDGTLTVDGTLFVPSGGTYSAEELDATVVKQNGNVVANDSTVVHKTGDETIAGVKSFTSSPTAPTPTTDYQVANKKYVDDKVNKPCFSAYKNDGNQSVTSGVSTKVTFTTEEYDRTGAYDITNSRFTPSVAGIYYLTSQVDVSGGTDIQLRVYKNGSPIRGARSTWTFTANSKFQFSCDIELVESDYVEMYITITGSTPVVYPLKSTFFQAHYVRS